MKKIYHLSSCSTCKRILNELQGDKDCGLQDIKTIAISEPQLDEMAKLAGSYEALFSRKALKYRGEGLHEQTLTEKDYKSWILKEYTFLKRPVIIINQHIFIGNSPKTISQAKALLNK